MRCTFAISAFAKDKVLIVYRRSMSMLLCYMSHTLTKCFIVSLNCDKMIAGHKQKEMTLHRNWIKYLLNFNRKK